MDTKVQKMLKKATDYIANSQPVIDKHNENRITFLKRAHQAAGSLAARGVIDVNDKDAFVDKIAEDESGVAVWDLVEKLASAITVDTLGSASQEKLAGAELDPFEKLAVYGDARADNSQSGMVD